MDQNIERNFGTFFLFFEKYDGETEDIHWHFLIAKENLKNQIEFDVYSINHSLNKEQTKKFWVVKR